MTKNQVAVIEPARLPVPKGLDETFGLDENAWKVLTEAVFPMAKTTASIVLALSYCKNRGLDVMKRPVHIVPIWSSAAGKMIESVWPGIDLHRTIAHRTRDYAGTEETKFGPMVEVTYEGQNRKRERVGPIKLRHPEWAQITVYRYVHGHRVPFHGPRCYFEEFYGERDGSRVPNARWERAPVQMLEKVAEAAALRKAFPEEIGGEMTADEMEGHDYEPHTIHADAPPQPERPAEIVVTAEEQRAAEEEADRLMMQQQRRDAGGWVDEVDNEEPAPSIIKDEPNGTLRKTAARRGAERWFEDRFAEVNLIADQDGLNLFTDTNGEKLNKLKTEHQDLHASLDLALKAAEARIASAL